MCSFLAAAACVGDQGPKGDPGDPAIVDPSLSPIDKAFAGIGGKDAVAQLSTFRLDVAGTRYFEGEEFEPGAPLPIASEYTGTITYDAIADASRFDIARQVKAFDLMVPPHMYSEIVRGNLGHVSGDDGLFGGSAGDLPPAGTAAIRKQLRLLSPQLILRDIARDPTLATNAGAAIVDGNLHQLVQVANPIAPITLYVDARTGRITKLSTLENSHVTRDIEITAFFDEWEATETGVLFPRHVYLATGTELTLDERRTAVAVDTAIDPAQLAFPADAHPAFDAAAAAEGELDEHFIQAFGSFGFRLDTIQDHVDASMLAPGVFRLGGGTHNSVAVEQANGIVIIDAPLYGARSQAIMQWAAAQFPTKKITNLIVSHFHDDHTGGVRDFVAAGVPVVTGTGTEGFLERAVAAPSRLAVDPLAQHPMPLKITRVALGQTLRLPDAAHPIDVIAVANTHAVDMVYARMPNDKVAFVADLYSPGFPPVFPIQLKQAIYDSLLGHGGSSDMIVGGHGGVAPFSQLATEAGH